MNPKVKALKDIKKDFFSNPYYDLKMIRREIETRIIRLNQDIHYIKELMNIYSCLRKKENDRNNKD